MGGTSSQQSDKKCFLRTPHENVIRPTVVKCIFYEVVILASETSRKAVGLDLIGLD